MSGYFLKHPNTTLDYTFDWGFQLFQAGEEIETDLGWSVLPEEGAEGGVSVSSTTSTLTTTTAFLTGGVPGQAYQVSSRVATTLGRDVARSLTVRIAES
ncbi:MAG: hypothetical protein AAGJ28_14265 [Pseudomonadota bacterium]